MCPMPLRALPLRCFLTASQKPVDDSDSLANGGVGGGRRRAAAGGTQNGRAHSHGASAREKGSKVGAVNGSSISLAEKKVRGNGSGGISSHGWACSVRSVCAQRETARAAERHGRRRAAGGTGVPIRTARAHEGRGTR